MLAQFGILNAHLLPTREAYPTRAYQSLAALAPRPSTDEGSPGEHRPVPDGIAIGDPDQIVAAIKRWEAVGVDGINFIINTAEVIPQPQVLDSLRVFARDVMPRFEGSRDRGYEGPSRISSERFHDLNPNPRTLLHSHAERHRRSRNTHGTRAGHGCVRCGSAAARPGRGAAGTVKR
jgi:hypothetical protein